MSAFRKAMKELAKQEAVKPLTPCKNGHVGLRYKCRHCVECERTLNTDRKEYMREYMRQYRNGKRRRKNESDNKG